jgi:hypothetical protein
MVLISKTEEKKYSGQIFLFLIKKLHFPVSQLQEKLSALKRENSALQKLFVGHFCPPGSGSGL